MIYELYKRYAEPHRRYHNLSHIFRMFEIAQERGVDLSREQVYAIWFHDAVYDIPNEGEASNEQKSADLVGRFYMHRDFCDRVKEIVLATEKVLQPETPDLTDEQWQVCGLDLYDLGTPNYWPNRDLIRQEFSHLGDEEWRKGRSAFLSMLADKEMLIGEPFFASICEMDGWHLCARQNMQRELEQIAAEQKEASEPPPPWPHTAECAFYDDCNAGFDHPRNCDCGADRREREWRETFANLT